MLWCQVHAQSQEYPASLVVMKCRPVIDLISHFLSNWSSSWRGLQGPARLGPCWLPQAHPEPSSTPPSAPAPWVLFPPGAFTHVLSAWNTLFPHLADSSSGSHFTCHFHRETTTSHGMPHSFVIIIFFVEKNTFLQEPFSVGKRQPWAFSLPNFSNISQNQRLSIHPLSSRCARHHFRYKWFNVKQTRPDKVPIPRGCILFQFFRSGLHINNMLSADSWIWKLEN